MKQHPNETPALKAIEYRSHACHTNTDQDSIRSHQSNTSRGNPYQCSTNGDCGFQRRLLWFSRLGL